MKIANSLSQDIQQGEIPVYRGQASITRQCWLALRRVAGIAVVELRLQLRSKTYWIMLLLLCLLNGVISWLLSKYSISDANRFLVNMVSTVVGEVLCLQPFLFMSSFARDQQRRMTLFLWTRPLTSASYALGKALAVIVMALLLEFQPLLISWVVSSIGIGAVWSPLPWLTLFTFASCSVILGGLFALCCITLSPVPLLGVLVAAGAALYQSFFLTRTSLQPFDLQLSTFYYSQIIGFGPDLPLVLWQTTGVLLMALLCLGLLLLVYQLRERRGIVFVCHRVLSLLLLVCAAVPLIPVYQAFHAATQQFQSFGLAEADPMFATISHYRVAVTADPRSGQLKGRASFTITPDKAGNTILYLLLNPGIQVRSVNLGMRDQDTTPSQFPYHSARGWTKLDIQQTGFMQGQALHISVLYDGKLAISRPYFTTGRRNIISYLEQGVGMLQGFAGQWYPLPWTQQALAMYGDRFPVEEAQVRLPATLKVLSTVTPIVNADKAWQEVTLRDARIPQAFVTALASPVQNDSPGGPIFSNAIALSQPMLSTYWNFVRQGRALAQWLSPAATHQPLQVVVMPLLDQVVASPGLLVLPEIPYPPLIIPKMPFKIDNTVIVPSAGNNIELAVVGSLVANAWLENELFTTTNVLNERWIRKQLNLADAMAFDIKTDDITRFLSEYTAAATTNRLVGQNYWMRLMDLCQQQYDLQFKPTETSTESAIISTELTFHLGVQYCENGLLGLMHVAQHYGRDRVDSFIPLFIARYQQTPTDGYTFMQELGQYLGHDLGPDAAPYMCQSPKARPGQKSTTATFDCMKRNTEQKVHVNHD